MAIQFNSLPSEKPGGALIEKGQYRAKIEKAEMKVSKQNPSNPPYLNLTLNIFGDNGQSKGKVFDMITESDNDYVRYKLKRFIELLGIPMNTTTVLELKDLAKLAPGKEMLVDITVDEKQTPARSVVDIFSGEIYYPLEEADDDIPFNAPDAEDAGSAEPAATGSTTY